MVEARPDLAAEKPNDSPGDDTSGKEGSLALARAADECPYRGSVDDVRDSGEWCRSKAELFRLN